MLIWTLTNALFVCPDPNYFIVIVAKLCFQNYNLNFTTGSHAKRFMKRIFLPSRIVNREKKMFLPFFSRWAIQFSDVIVVPFCQVKKILLYIQNSKNFFSNLIYKKWNSEKYYIFQQQSANKHRSTKFSFSFSLKVLYTQKNSLY